MSWISDVKYELIKLDVSKKSLRKFGITIGLILIIAALVFYYFNIYFLVKITLFVIGTILIISGTIVPSILLSIYKIWMGFSFILGWFVSRFLLSILFIFVLTPIGLFAKFVNKRFLNLSFNIANSSYWIKISNTAKKNYKKMY